jgi:hypothetical protein
MICLRFLNYIVKVSDGSKSLTGTERPLNTALSLSMEFAAKARLMEGQFRRLKL